MTRLWALVCSTRSGMVTWSLFRATAHAPRAAPSASGCSAVHSICRSGRRPWRVQPRCHWYRSSFSRGTASRSGLHSPPIWVERTRERDAGFEMRFRLLLITSRGLFVKLLISGSASEISGLAAREVSRPRGVVPAIDLLAPSSPPPGIRGRPDDRRSNVESEHRDVSE